MMPMQIGAVRTNTKPTSRAKASSIETSLIAKWRTDLGRAAVFCFRAADRLVSAEFLRGRGHRLGTEAVGCYMIHEKIARAIHRKLYVILYYGFPSEAIDNK
jgi:hypothetical protein